MTLKYALEINGSHPGCTRESVYGRRCSSDLPYSAHIISQEGIVGGRRGQQILETIGSGLGVCGES